MARKPTGMPNGRPLRYRSAKELKKVIDDYFLIKQGSLTITGLAMHLGFYDRHALYEYAKRGEFSSTIKTAVNRLCDYVEDKLMKGEGYGPGLIFWLKNHEWSDKQEIEHSGKIEGLIRLPPKKAIGDAVGLDTTPPAV